MKHSKSILAGLILVAAVIALTIGYTAYSTSTRVTTLSGYVGGEKIGFLEDPETTELLQKKYHLKLDYSKAGSLDMVTADQTGRDYLWPSSQTALEYYKQAVGKPVKSEIIFNTPIVLYTRKAVCDALMKKGIVAADGTVYTIDMKQLADLISSGTSWSDIGLTQLYGNITVGTTDPTKSNSGNMFAGILANTLAGGIANEQNIDDVLPELRDIFSRLGYMESSSSDIFDQFLRTGMGAKPLIAGYESQLLEFAAENPDIWSQISGDVIMLYPTPTAWSSHVFIATDEAAVPAIEALQDRDLQKLAWEKHGFRTGVSGAAADTSAFTGISLAANVDSVVPLPDYPTMAKIIAALGNNS